MSLFNSQSYLGCLGRPFEHLCCNLSLKTGFLVVAWWNLVSAGLIVVAFIVQIALMAHYGDPSLFFNFSLIRNLIGLAVGVSAAFGLKGLYRVDVGLLSQYYIMRLLFGPLGNVLFAVDVMLHSSTAGYIVAMVLFALGEIVLSLFLTKIVWSVLVRIEYGQVQLVLTGKGHSTESHQGILQGSGELVPGKPRHSYELGLQ